jgi:hypothetical protein
MKQLLSWFIFLTLAIGVSALPPAIRNNVRNKGGNFAPSVGGGSPSWVIVRTNTYDNTIQFPVVPAQTHTAGNAIAVGIWTPFGSVTVSSVTNTAGDTFTQCSGSRISVDQSIEWWLATSSAGHASDKIGVALSTARGCQIVVVEFSGQAASTPFETAATGSSSASTTVTSASFSPASSGNLNLAYSGQYNSAGGAYTAGANYTLLINGTTYNTQCEQRQSAPAGAQTASITQAANDDNVITVISIKPQL